MNPWQSNCPYKTTKYPTLWVSHASSGTVTVPIGTPYLPLNYDWVHPNTGRRPVWGDVIEKYPELASGWEKDALRRMQQLLSGTPMILGGFLRIMPVPSDRIRVTTTVQGTEQLLAELDRHIGAGRVPVLKNETKRAILERARQYEIERYGRPLRAAVTAQPPLQPSLFD
ncbi:MAG: hypothetical protein FJ304_28065 [Planctomycetes bacterium]|nr:hypothetical protein [Planctomycetota bacterium]